MNLPLLFFVIVAAIGTGAMPLPLPSGSAPAAGTARLSLSGNGLNTQGTFPTTRCGDPFIVGGTGIVFETRFGGGKLTLIDETARKPGAQSFVTDKGTMMAFLTRDDGTAYVLAKKPGSATLSPDLRQLTFDIQVRGAAGFLETKGMVRVQGSYVCG